jgi:hypothetical protein
MPDASQDLYTVRFLEYMQESINRAVVEEPITPRSHPFLQWVQDVMPADAHVAPIRGGLVGLLEGFFPWMHARYPDEAEAVIRSCCHQMGVPDEIALFRQLRDESGTSN